MMIESECNTGSHITRSSPMNGRHSGLHQLHLLANNQCIVSVDTTDTVGSPTKRISICMGCGHEIYDQYILRVAPDLEWHQACLKCVECQQFLDETCTCFVRDGKTYCRRDYVRQFGAKCAKCNQLFRKSDYVMRARNKIYHIECFRCTACFKALLPGDEFAMREDGLFCKADHESMDGEKIGLNSSSGGQSINNNNNTSTTTAAEATIAALCGGDPNGNGGGIDSSVVGTGDLELLGGPLSSFAHLHPPNNDGRTPPLGVQVGTRSLPTVLGVAGGSQQPGHHHHHHHSFLQHQSSSCSVSSPDSFCGDERSESGHGGLDHLSNTSGGGGGGNGGTSSGGGKKDKKDKPKTTRVRTVLNEKQLHTLRTCYNANPRPDALMKEQLVEMTGLSPRVIRVWFQNKRCKDKKKQILMKQIQQQQEKNQALNGIRLQGVGPLIAGSPTRHDMPMVQALDVHQYQQSSALWAKAQAMADYHHHGAPLPPELAMHPLESHHQTPFQQLMHGFGDPHAAEAAALGGCYMQSTPGGPGGFGPPPPGPIGGLDPNELGSLSPHLAPSDLSSPSCSE